MNKRIIKWLSLLACTLLAAGFAGCMPNTNSSASNEDASSVDASHEDNYTTMKLAYEVNADGTSCTVTGIGTCEVTEIRVPKAVDGYTVTAIGEEAFAEQTQLTLLTIPSTVNSIGTRAFYGCTGLTEFTIPSSVTSIGTQIFYKCDNLSTVYYNSTYSSSSNPFLNLNHIQKIVFNGKYVSSSILEGYTNIKEVVIGDSVTSIGAYAFSGCSSLTSVVINGGSIGYYAFNGCDSLTSVEIGDSVTSIGENAFYECSSLTSVEIPDSVTSIGWFAFYGCSSLTSVEIPDSVTSIGNWAFYKCSSLTNITFNGTIAQWNAISKGGSWDNKVPAAEVVCSDGVVAI